MRPSPLSPKRLRRSSEPGIARFPRPVPAPGGILSASRTEARPTPSRSASSRSVGSCAAGGLALENRLADLLADLHVDRAALDLLRPVPIPRSPRMTFGLLDGPTIPYALPSLQRWAACGDARLIKSWSGPKQMRRSWMSGPPARARSAPAGRASSAMGSPAGALLARVRRRGGSAESRRATPRAEGAA